MPGAATFSFQNWASVQQSNRQLHLRNTGLHWKAAAEHSEAKAFAQAVLDFEASFTGVAHILKVKNVTLGADRN